MRFQSSDHLGGGSSSRERHSSDARKMMVACQLEHLRIHSTPSTVITSSTAPVHRLQYNIWLFVHFHGHQYLSVIRIIPIFRHFPCIRLPAYTEHPSRFSSVLETAHITLGPAKTATARSRAPLHRLSTSSRLLTPTIMMPRLTAHGPRPTMRAACR